MERLKGQVSEHSATTGELVTRADGTQAVRVRKRKRRTEQPKREEAKRLKRLRMIQVGSALVLLLLALLVGGAAYVYANTAPYRKSIADAIAANTGAKVDFKLFRVSPASANAESVDLEWPAGNLLKSIQLRGVTARISPLSLLGTSLRGDEVSAREGALFLQVPEESAQPAAADHPAKMPVRFDRIAVPRCTITFGDPAKPGFRINASEASLRLDKPNKQTSLHLYRGNIQIAGWPALKIDRAVMDFRESEAELILLRLIDSHPKRGILDLAGNIRPFDVKARSILSVKVDSFDFGELFGTDMGELISAKIDSRPDAESNQLSFTPGSLADAELSIAFKNTLSSRVSLKGFPFLLSLVRTLNDKWYENPSFVGDSTGIARRKGQAVEIRDLRLESKSRMAIKADIAATADKSLYGTMEIGIPESVAELSPNGKIHSMLTPPRDGYRWLTLKLGGTLAHPSDDFAALYAAAPEPAAEDSGEPATDPDPQKAFDKITRPKDP